MAKLVCDDVSSDVRVMKEEGCPRGACRQALCARGATEGRTRLGRQLKVRRQCRRDLTELVGDFRFKPTVTAEHRGAELTESIIRYGLHQPGNRTQSNIHSSAVQLLVPELHSFVYSMPSWITLNETRSWRKRDSNPRSPRQRVTVGDAIRRPLRHLSVAVAERGSSRPATCFTARPAIARSAILRPNNFRSLAHTAPGPAGTCPSPSVQLFGAITCTWIEAESTAALAFFYLLALVLKRLYIFHD